MLGKEVCLGAVSRRLGCHGLLFCRFSVTQAETAEGHKRLICLFCPRGQNAADKVKEQQGGRIGHIHPAHFHPHRYAGGTDAQGDKRQKQRRIR